MRISDWSSDVCSSDLASRNMLRLLDDIIAIATIEVGQMALDPDDLAAEDLWQPQSTQWLDLAEQRGERSEEHTSELQSLMRISYAVFCLKKKIKNEQKKNTQKRKAQSSTKTTPKCQHTYHGNSSPKQIHKT